jgi:mannobiose 2-epimerase
MDNDTLRQFKLSVQKELDENIIPFWAKRTIDDRGGFIGRMTNNGVIDAKAPKGLILNTRLLWTFSALYVFQKKSEHLVLAQRAYDYLMEHFWDGEHGGMFWTVDWQGRPLEDKKQIYGQAFAIYALSEYYRASGRMDALDRAKVIFDLIERYARDKKYKGYFESYDRDWKMAKDQQLSAVDMAEKKSMNTHLHMLEALANLYDVWKDALLGQRLEELVDILADRIVHPDGTHCQLFFDELWRPKTERVSFGHDIETSWLLYKDAQILNKPRLLEKIRPVGLKLAEAVYDHGLDNKKSLFYEAEPSGVSNSEKHWWVQVEAVVGFLNAYQLSGRREFFEVAHNIWKFIEDYLVDKENGEWFYKVSAEGKVDSGSFKVSEWKCPYHNCRACMEIITRLEEIPNKKHI